MPELTHPGESKTNGFAERSVRTLEEQTRTLLLALEAKLNMKVPASHPLLGWIVEHAAFTLNKYMLGRDGRTAFGRLHGKETRDHICELGEKVLWFVPAKLRAKLDQKWRYGIFLGRSLSSDQMFIGIAGGDVVRAKAIIRLVPSCRWDMHRIMG